MFNWIKNKLKAAHQTLKDGLSSPWRWLLVPTIMAGGGIIAGFGGFVVPSAAVISGVVTAVSGLMVLELRYQERNAQEEEQHRRDMTQLTEKSIKQSTYEEQLTLMSERLKLLEKKVSVLEEGQQDIRYEIKQGAEVSDKRYAETAENINAIQTELTQTQSSDPIAPNDLKPNDLNWYKMCK